MKFYDIDTHEIFEATRDEFEKYMESYHESIRQDTFLLGYKPQIFVPRVPSLKGHRYFIYKVDEEYTMIKFEDKFVHFRWDAALEGKLVCFGDTICALEHYFKDQIRGYAHPSPNQSYPFQINGKDWKFAYYDPNFECKVAFNEGKQIQCRGQMLREWKDIKDPCWEAGTEYRIKPEEPEAYVILNKADDVPVLLWKASNERETRRKYFQGMKCECTAYIESHMKFVRLMAAWEEGKKIQIKQGCSWIVVENPSWSVSCEYRIKPAGLQWTDLQLGDVIQKGSTTTTVISIDCDSAKTAHIQASHWIADEDLEEWHKV